MALIVLANGTALFNGILEPDGALYAGIAKHMVIQNDWINLWGDAHDWLDKPHFPFWMAALSFKCFGFNALAYKLPSFLCYLISIVYVFRLSESLYNKETAKLAALIYASALHLIISNFDGKVEIELTCFSIAAIFHLWKAHGESWFKHMLFAALWSAAAIMTKGVFCLITIGAGFAFYWIISGQWKQWWSVRWYLWLLLTGIFILPEIYALYQQFDVHPEKIVFGKTHVSGVRFFFWDSQFGRFFNNGPIKGQGEPTFFLHSTLWAFLPWSFALIAAIVKGFRPFQPKANPARWILVGSAAISFLIFSLSKFQLPHYILILFPQFAIITAQWWIQSQSSLNGMWVAKNILHVITLVVMVLISVYFFDHHNWYYWIPFWIAGWVLTWKKNGWQIISGSVVVSVMIALFLNLLFYPKLLTYQSGMMAGQWLNKHRPGEKVLMNQCNSYTLTFYTHAEVVPTALSDTALQSLPKGTLIYTSLDSFQLNNKGNHSLQPLAYFPHYRISMLDAGFLNKATRTPLLDTFVLAQQQSPQP